MPTYTFVDIPASCLPGGACTLPLTLVTGMTRQTVYGFGAAPVGGEVRFRAARPLAFVVRGSAGGVYFSQPVPDPEERRFNFMFDLGAGAEFRFSRRLAVTAGYRLNHISNAGRGPVNPGMNSQMLEVGVSFAKAFW
jgi:opacity protein-like surface antigen